QRADPGPARAGRRPRLGGGARRRRRRDRDPLRRRRAGGRPVPRVPRAPVLPRAGRGAGGRRMTATSELGVRYGATDVAERLGLPRPTPEQVAVIEAPLEPVLVVAGAGSGKTETMTARVVHLVVNGLVEPERVLGLTFTRKAAGELGQRVRARLRALRAAGLLDAAGDDRVDGGRASLVGPTISTYNSYAAGLVTDHAMRLGIEPASRLVGEAARWQLAAEVVEQWVEDLGTDYAATTVINHVLDLAGQMAEHLVEPDEVRAHLDALVDALDAVPTGEARAAARNAVRAVRESLALRSRLVDLVAELT